MIRTAFLASGLTLVLWGAALLAVDEVTLTESASQGAVGILDFISTATTGGRRVVHPAEWIPFTCLGVGGVTMLYAIALPRK